MVWLEDRFDGWALHRMDSDPTIVVCIHCATHTLADMVDTNLVHYSSVQIDTSFHCTVDMNCYCMVTNWYFVAVLFDLKLGRHSELAIRALNHYFPLAQHLFQMESLASFCPFDTHKLSLAADAQQKSHQSAILFASERSMENFVR